MFLEYGHSRMDTSHAANIVSSQDLNSCGKGDYRNQVQLLQY